MTKRIKISRPSLPLDGTIRLDGSKSISNRALIIRYLCKDDIQLNNISSSDDTRVLQGALANKDLTLDVGSAGTSFRFLTASLCLNSDANVLTGSERMLERPIGPLVDALRTIGSEIEYLGEEGYPPLAIGSIKKQLNKSVTVTGDISSQFITALLLIAPALPLGLEINITGTIVSRPYIEMTLKLMEHFGISHAWLDNSISVTKQSYASKPLDIESDWSGASYFYGMAAFAESCNLKLKGLQKNSIQGDSAIATIAEKFGVLTSYEDDGICLQKTERSHPMMLEQDFIKCPDLAQTVSIMCAGNGTSGLFTGLETLKIKETDRISALQAELLKLEVFLSALPKAKFSKKSQHQFYMQEGLAKDPNPLTDISIATYEDHRMALAFSCLAVLFPISIEKPGVVSKSYPDYWEDIKTIGFEIESEAS